MENLIKLHETAARIVWNINNCRHYQKLSFEALELAKCVHYPEAIKSANESMRLYKKCEQRFLERYQKVLTKINNLVV